MIEVKNNVPALRFPGFEQEWSESKLGDICDFLDSKRIPLSESERQKRKGNFPYYGASGIIDYIDDFLFDGEFILLGEDGANILNRSTRLAFIVKGKIWVNNHAHVLRAYDSNYFLSEALERINYDKYNTGTAQPKLNVEVCKNIKLFLPTLPEQQKIAAFLSAIDRKIQQLQQKAALLEQYKKGVMQQIFSQEIRFKPDSRQGNDEDRKDFPEWEVLRAKEIFKDHSNKNHNGDLPILAATQDNGVVYRDTIGINIQSSDASIKSYKIVEKGDFVISLRSFQGGIEYSNVKGICSPAYTILKPKVDIDNQFFKYYFKKESFIKRLSATVVGIREGKQISYEAFSGMKLHFPDVKEQKKIADFLKSIDTKINQTQTQLEKTQEYKKGLLQQLFV